MKTKSVKIIMLLALFGPFGAALSAQSTDLDSSGIAALKAEIAGLRNTELVQSMSQRSILTPSYYSELKALVARQAYNFWKAGHDDHLVSHLNVYSALYYANKYLGYDSVNLRSYNQAFGHNKSVISLKYGSDPRILYSAGSDGQVIRWQMDQGFNTPEVIYEGNHLIRSIDISEGDKWILVVTKESGIVLISNPQGEESEIQVVRDPELVQTAVFMPGEQRVVMVTRSGTLKYKSPVGEEMVGEIDGQVASMAVNPKSKDVYLGKSTGSVQIWEDTLALSLFFEESFSVNTMAISPDYRTLALGREKGDVILWDLTSQTLKRKISGHQSAITDLDFNPDGTLLLSASRDRTVRVWDINNSKKLPLVLDDHDDWVMTACFDPTGHRIVSGSRDNYLRFWPVEHDVLADRICELVHRNLTFTEWEEYVGTTVPYQETCLIK